MSPWCTRAEPGTATHRDGQHVARPLPHQRGWFIDHGKMYDDTKRIFEELDIDIDLRVKVGFPLSVSQMQMIEIAKAFSYDAKIVIMDEPTSSLTEKEVNHLFKIINKLQGEGCGIVTSPTRWKRSSSSVTRSLILRDSQWVATQSLERAHHGQDHRHDGRPRAHPAFPGKTNQPERSDPRGRTPDGQNQPSIKDDLQPAQGEISASPVW